MVLTVNLSILQKFGVYLFIILDFDLREKPHLESFLFVNCTKTQMDTQLKNQSVHKLLWVLISQYSLLPHEIFLMRCERLCLLTLCNTSLFGQKLHVVIKSILYIHKIGFTKKLIVNTLAVQIHLKRQNQRIQSLSWVKFISLIGDLQDEPMHSITQEFLVHCQNISIDNAT